MDTTAASELGLNWGARRGLAASSPAAAAGGEAGGAANKLGFWNAASPGQEAYTVQPYDPLSPHHSSNPRRSRWGLGADDVPAMDTAPGSKFRTPVGSLEPPNKKMRNIADESLDLQTLHSQRSADYRYQPSGGYAADYGLGEIPSGSLYDRSGTGMGRSDSSALPVAPAQSYGYKSGEINESSSGRSSDFPSVQSYGTGFGFQQTSGYGSRLSPDFTSPQGVVASAASGPGDGKPKGTGSLYYKTKMCTKFKTGSCTFNERCNFAHSMEELRKPPTGWEETANSTPGKGALFNSDPAQVAGRPFDVQKPNKTRVCRYFVDGNCPYGERCNFLHGAQDPLRNSGTETASEVLNPTAGKLGNRGPNATKPSFKTRLCSKWEKGQRCDFGDKCHFAHGLAELQKYGGGSVHPDGEASVGAVKPLVVKPDMTGAKLYSDFTGSDSLPSSVQYGGLEDFMGSISKVGGEPFSASDIKSYQSPGTVLKSSSSPIDGNNGGSTDYTYWGEQEKWVSASPAARYATFHLQGYAQANQRSPWGSEFDDVTYDRKDDEVGFDYYFQQEPQQHQNASFFRGGNVNYYASPDHNISSPYGQDEV